MSALCPARQGSCQTADNADFQPRHSWVFQQCYQNFTLKTVLDAWVLHICNSLVMPSMWLGLLLWSTAGDYSAFYRVVLHPVFLWKQAQLWVRRKKSTKISLDKDQPSSGLPLFWLTYMKLVVCWQESAPASSSPSLKHLPGAHSVRTWTPLCWP